MAAAPLAGQPIAAARSGALARATAKFAAVLVVGWLAWPVIGASFDAAFQGTASAVLGGLEFGKGGHAEFLPVHRSSARSVEKDASWDARVRLHIDGVDKAHTVVINPRRLAYLPLLVLAATLFALGLRRKAMLAAFGLGFVVLCGAALTSVWITVAWLFARVPGLVYSLAPWPSAALHVLYEGFVTPIANKFIVSVLLALLCARLVRDLDRPAAPAVALGRLAADRVESPRRKKPKHRAIPSRKKEKLRLRG